MTSVAMSTAEAEGDVGAVDVVVDGLGQADDVQALLRQQVGRFVRAVAAQAEQAVQLHLFIVFLHGGDLVHLVVAHHPHEFEGGALGAQNGAAHCEDTGKFPRLHHAPIAVDQALVAVQNADDLHIVVHAFIQRLCDAPESGVEARAVAAGGEDANPSFHLCISPFHRAPRQKKRRVFSNL